MERPPQMMQASDHEELQKILANIPADEEETTSVALRQARRQGPSTSSEEARSIKGEVTVQDFFDYEDGNIEATTARWNAYWRERVHLFGDRDARARGDCSLLNASAMSSDEMTLFQSGLLRTDVNCSILYIDLSKRIQSNTSDDCLPKVLFLWMNLLTIRRAKPNQKRTFSMVLSEADWKTLDTSVIVHLYNLHTRIFPIALESVHVIMETESSEKISADSSKTMGKPDLPLEIRQCLVWNTARELNQDETIFPRPCNGDSFTDWLQGNPASIVESEGIIPNDSSATPGKGLHRVMRFVETSSMQQKGLAQLQEAIETMELHEKEAYLQALRNCPQLVEHETPPLWFLRYENYDGWAAGKRLVYYWKSRLEVFGPRAFLPMSQTGRGTLSFEDIEVLRTGYLAILPKTPSGHQTMCYDASRLSHCAAQNRRKRLRCFFYIQSVLMEEEINRIDGAIALGIMNNFTIARSFGLNDPTRLWEHAFPITIHSLHAVRCKSSIPLLKSTLPLLAMVAEKAWPVMHFHLGDSDEVLTSMETKGLPATVLPEQIGGEWTYARFDEWCRERCQFEAEKYPSMIPGTVPTVVNPDSPNGRTGDKTKRRREMRVIYSREKRQREKEQLNNLYEQLYSLRNQQRDLQNENARLNQLVARARQAVAHYQHMSEPRASWQSFW